MIIFAQFFRKTAPKPSNETGKKYLAFHSSLWYGAEEANT